MELDVFMLQVAELLEEHDIDILFAPQFTPTLDDRAQISELLYHWKPSNHQIAQLVPDLDAAALHAIVQTPDGTDAKLPLHEVMIDRFVRLMHFDRIPDLNVSGVLRDALPTDLWPIGDALLRQRGFTPTRQAWFAGFITHMAAQRSIDRGLLIATAEFVADHINLDVDKLANEARALCKAAERSVAFAQGGHNYWSPDVAQHHHYRGQGQIDKDLVQQRHLEQQWLEAIAADLQSYEDHKA